jgi:hypothetical protein
MSNFFLSFLSKAKGKESLHTSFVKAGGQPAVAPQTGNADEISLDDDDEEEEEDEDEGAPATKKNIGGLLRLKKHSAAPVFYLERRASPVNL